MAARNRWSASYYAIVSLEAQCKVCTRLITIKTKLGLFCTYIQGDNHETNYVYLSKSLLILSSYSMPYSVGKLIQENRVNLHNIDIEQKSLSYG